jgi:hypothetical protein
VIGQTPPLARVAAITDSLSAVISKEQDCKTIAIVLLKYSGVLKTFGLLP